MSINRGTDKEDVVLFNGILLSHNKELNWVLCRDVDCPKGFPDSSVGKVSTCNAGDPGSIPGLGRSSGEGKGYPLQYFGLENSMNCIVHGVPCCIAHGTDLEIVTKSQVSQKEKNKYHILMHICGI